MFEYTVGFVIGLLAGFAGASWLWLTILAVTAGGQAADEVVESHDA